MRNSSAHIHNSVLALIVSIGGGACTAGRVSGTNADNRALMSTTHKTIDLGSLYSDPALARTASYYARSSEHALARRVAIGSNLVFESAQSAIPEPPTTGPRDPALVNALGTPVHPALGATLLNLLASKQIEVYPPEAIRAIGTDASCEKGCGASTWVERWIQGLHGASARQAEEFPAVALAVREFRLSVVKLELAIYKDQKTGELSLGVASADRPAACPTAVVEVPSIVLGAELISLRDGHLMAHIDEFRSIRPARNLVRSIIATETITKESQDPYGATKASTSVSNVECPNSWKEVSAFLEEVKRLPSLTTPPAEALLKGAFSQLLP
jgi:hypothetical protein